MIHIAICDDDENVVQVIDDVVEECCHRINGIYSKTVFQNGNNLLYEVEEGTHFDVLLLDIEMPHMNGIEITEKIRKFLPNVIVIFVTCYEKYVYDAFKVQPFRFVPKTQISRMLMPAVEDALRLAAKLEGKFYVAGNQKRLEKIPVKNITYIWHQEKYAYIEKIDGKYTKVRKTLKQVFSELPMEEFAWVDKGCIVALLQIERIVGQEIILSGGTRIPVSRDRLTEVKKKIRDYWMERDA